jgi:hypothetical protein
VNLLEEKILHRELECKLDFTDDLVLTNRDKEESLEKLVFYKIIELMNQKKTYMFGAEKAATARFISKHRIDVYKILKEIIKGEIK